MKALTVRQPWASDIAEGRKTIETRTWKTPHRGDLLITASKRPKIEGLPTGVALCIVDLVDCRPLTIEDEDAALCVIAEGECDGLFAWVLKNLRVIDPFKVSGALGLFVVDEPSLR